MPKKKTYYIKTFGCQMNHSDSQRFATVIEGVGYQPTENWKQADLIVFNTCSVRQKAEDRVMGMGRQINEIKANNPELKIVLSGCMARRTWQGVAKTGSPIQMSDRDREQQLKSLLPWVDVVLETKDFGKLPQKLGIINHNSSTEILSAEGGAEHYLSFKPKQKNGFQAYVPISTGCDHFCTYCIVPFSRGNEVCRSAESIIAEVFNLVKGGYKDITLLGQTVNRWVNPHFDDELKQGMIANTKIPTLNTLPLNPDELTAWKELFESIDFEIDTDWVTKHVNELAPAKDFLQLLQVLDQISGQWWTTWVSSHPNYMTPQLIDFVESSASCGFWNENSTSDGHQRPYLHFALQSGSDAILKRMNRRYSYQEFSEVVRMMDERISGLSISTDIIVGFPRESEIDFAETVKAVQECRFDMVYISEYSPRKGTAAGLLKDDIPAEQKLKWKNYLNDEILEPITQSKLQKMIGTTQYILIDSADRKSNQLIGRTPNNKQTKLVGVTDPKLIGTFAKVRITGCSAWALTAELL